MRWLVVVGITLAISVPSRQAAAQTIVTQEIRIPTKGTGSKGLDALMVLRRGFGDSGGSYDEESHSCANPDYVGATKESSEQGHYGLSFGRRTDNDAENKALDNCKEAAPKKDRCTIAMLNDTPTP
jgi:hypothetical protein